GRRRVQTRRARPDLPQVHVRRIRGEARATGRAEERGCRSGRSGRVLLGEHLLGAEGAAMVALAPTPGSLQLASSSTTRWSNAMVAIKRDNQLIYRPPTPAIMLSSGRSEIGTGSSNSLRSTIQSISFGASRRIARKPRVCARLSIAH